MKKVNHLIVLYYTTIENCLSDNHIYFDKFLFHLFHKTKTGDMIQHTENRKNDEQNN